MNASLFTESEYVSYFFKDTPNGRFLEIGSNDGEPDNPAEPCWPLVKMGWSGVYCEPNPNACSKLLKNIKPFKDIIVVNSAIDVANGLRTFYMSDEYPMCASFNEDWLHQQTFVDSSINQYSIVTNTTTLTELINYTGSNFDCVSIDIECYWAAYEEIIIKNFDWARLSKCKLVITEQVSSFIKDYFESLGYVYGGQTKTGHNHIFTRQLN
jgi:FkbM family methyltransferase